MKIYYVIPENVGDEFMGYSTNQYLIAKFCDQLNKFSDNKIMFEINSIDIKSETEFVNNIDRIIGLTNTPYKYYDKLNKLYSIKDDYSDEIIVINKRIYEKFITDYITFCNLNKTIYDFYKHFKKYGLLLNTYIVNPEYKLILDNIIRKVSEDYYDEMVVYKEFSNFELHKELSSYEVASFWEVFNLYNELTDYINNHLKAQFIFKLF